MTGVQTCALPIFDLATPTTPVRAVTPHAASPVVAGQTSEPTAPLPTTAPEPQPPALPPIDLTPATYHAPPGVAPWMQGLPAAAAGPVRRLALTDAPQPVADRRGHFVMMTTGSTDLVGQHGTKVRITLLPGPTGQRVVHLKGLTCFVAHLGGRPSPAVTIDRSSDVALVTPRAQEIGHLRVLQGMAGPGQSTFTLGNDHVAIASDDCGDPILFDFGPGSEAYFVYTRGRPVPKSGRRG